MVITATNKFNNLIYMNEEIIEEGLAVEEPIVEDLEGELLSPEPVQGALDESSEGSDTPPTEVL